jgi:hypothetical protein
MDRATIYNRIEETRKEQDIIWPRDERRKVMYSFIPPHLTMLEVQVQKLRDEWYASKSEDCIKRLEHIAAVAVRALEEITPFK